MVENLEKKYKEILKWGALQGITDTPFPSSPSSSPPSSSSSSYRPDFEQQQEQSSCLGFSLEIAVFSGWVFWRKEKLVKDFATNDDACSSFNVAGFVSLYLLSSQAFVPLFFCCCCCCSRRC
jgi:hypothetical protein